MSKRGAAQPRFWSLIWLGVVVLALAVVWALLVPGADWLAHHDVGSATGTALATARDAARGRLLTLGAGLVAVGALLFTARNFTLSREGQVTDRYTKAIEQLGSDKLDVRIGGIYALERIARDSARDHPAVMDVLTAFIREHCREPWPVDDSGAQDGKKKTRADVQAAVTVAGRREVKRDVRFTDLSRADLTGAALKGAFLAGAVLTAATLHGADLTEADLHGARLNDTDLRNADLGHANLKLANLSKARLMDAHFFKADLRHANLMFANLVGTLLIKADLRHASLGGADLTGAILTKADLRHADFTLANLTSVMWTDGVPVPAGWILDADSGRLMRGGELSEITAHYP